jgi:RND family efflux transporter MFP subunit
MNSRQDDYPTPGTVQRPGNRLRLFALHVLLPLVTLAFGIGLTAYLLNTGPKATPGKRVVTATLVEVEELTPGPRQVRISAMGEIIAAREIELRPRVSGEIIEVGSNFLPGGFFSAGEKMISIDRSDYQLIARQLATDLARAESDLAIEMGNQRIAARELDLLGEKVSSEEKDLILRLPQLQKLRATRDYAQSRLDMGLLNLERTTIRAPFNGVIVSRKVDVGAKVTETTPLAEFVGVDVFWLRLALSVEQLPWLTIPGDGDGQGSLVHIYPQGGGTATATRSGRVAQLGAGLEKQGRMAQLLVNVDDPLSRREENHDKPKLLLGSYVRAEVEGATVASAFNIARAHIHNGDTVWLMDDNGMLEIRKVDIVYRGRDHVIVTGGIEEGDRLVTSALAAPVAGTALRLKGDAVEKPPGGKADPTGKKGGGHD